MRFNWRARAAVLALVTGLLAAGCAKDEQVAEPSTTPAPVGTAPSTLPTPGKAVASKEVDWPERISARWSVFSLYRHGKFVTLEFGATNVGAQPLDLDTRMSSDGERNDVSGVTLRDSAGKKRYSPASYGGECYCTFDAFPVSNGQTMYLSATYAAPPAGSKSVDVSIPAVGTFADVPVQAAPTSRAAFASPPGLPKAVASRPTQLLSSTENRISPSKTYVVTSVYGVYREGREVVALMGLSLTGALPYDAVTGVPDMYTTMAGSTTSDGITLVDAAGGRAYRAARDANGQCLCPDSNPQVAAYSTTVFTVTFAAPSAKTTKVDVVAPHAGVFAGVPVSPGKPPRPDAPAPLPHSTFPNVVAASPNSDGDVAKAPVVTVETPVYSSG